MVMSVRKKMDTNLRTVGIPGLDKAPWGMHFCQFFKSKEGLIETLVPYFKEGLENNEFCYWVTTQPLDVNDARKAMISAVSQFDRYEQDKQFEIVQSDEWYFKDSNFDVQRVLQGWQEKLHYALARGYDGMRATGWFNPVWLDQTRWHDFYEYEQMLNETFEKSKMIVLCNYALDHCGVNEVIDVIRNHHFTRIERKGAWDWVESAELKRTKEELKRLNDDLEVLVDERTGQLKATNQELQKAHGELAHEHDRLRLLLDVNNAVVSTLDLNEILKAIRASFFGRMQMTACWAWTVAEKNRCGRNA